MRAHARPKILLSTQHDSLGEYLATSALLKEAAADEASDRHACMRERAGLPFAALTKQEIPAAQKTAAPCAT